MWHELVLHGIGGRTIAEAVHRISYPEFLRWCAFRRKRGSLNLGMRLEEGFAMLASVYVNMKSRVKYSRYDFMDHDDGPPISLENAMETWK